MPVSIDDIELRSEQVQHILKKPPPSLVRWGTAVIFLAFAVAVTFALLIKYPSAITGKISLQANNTMTLQGEVKVAQDVVRNVQPGQPVRIQLDLYSHHESGTVTGNVKEVASTINADKTVSVIVILESPNGSIVLQNGMTGNAEIITGNQTIAAKLLGLLQ